MKQNGFQFSKSKSLSEQINEVCKSKMSKKDKMATLEVCGLKKAEIADILGSFRTPVTRPVTHRFAYTFGVEIECYHAERRALMAAGESNGITINSEGYNHNDSKSYYKIVSDGSLTGVDNNDVVSPILNGEKSGFDSLKAVTKALDEVGAMVNRSCGLHVHIGTKGMTDEWYINVFKNYQRLENLINSFMAPSRRGQNGYCKSIKNYHFENCRTIYDVSCMMGRYHVVNPAAWRRHGTIEFRQHQGTTDFEKISNWVKFVGKLVGWSKNNTFESDVTNVNGLPFLTKEEKAFFKARQMHFAII